jgi:hypothetical protein
MPSINITDSVTKTDLKRIEESLKRVLEATKNDKLSEDYIDLLHQVVNALNEVRLLVEFDHEKRLQAIEDFLQNL